MLAQPTSSHMEKSAATPQGKTAPVTEEWLESRFGKIKVNYTNALSFPRGVLGFPENLDFCLAEFPNEKMRQFKILQCLNDKELAFVVLPMNVGSELVEKPDIDEACEILGIESKDVAVLFIVSVHRKTTSVSLSANVRAPIIIDSERRLAAQFVLPNNKYQIRHYL